MEFNKSEEAVLIEAIKNGERAGFDRLVDMHKHRGLSIAYNMVGNLEDAKDVLQEAFVKVYVNINRFRQESSFATWFYRVIVNCALDLLRKRKASKKIFSEPLVDEEGKQLQAKDPGSEPKKIILDNELSRKLEDAIDSLPERQKACFVLKYRNGMNAVEIAEVLKCSHSTVKVHLFRAVRALQDKLRPYLNP